jgi:tetratricopeptide (TPR) repeat protein
MNKLFLILALACAVPAPAFLPRLGAAQQPGPEAHLRAGIEAYRAGRLDTAIARLRQAYAASPANAEAQLYLGLFLYEKARDSLEAQKLMEAVADRFPANTDLQLRLLDSYLNTKNASKAAEFANRLRPRISADPRFAFNVIYTFIHHNTFTPARDLLAGVSRELQGEVSFMGAMIALGSGDEPEGLKLMQNAQRLGFPKPDSRQMLTSAEALFKLRDLPGAARAYAAWLESHPDDTSLRFRLGLCYFGYADFNKALEQMELVRKKAPQMPDLEYYTGAILIELKRTDEARRHFEAELTRDPNHYKAMTKIAYLEYLDGNDAKCTEWLAKSAAVNPRWFETRMVYGLLYNRQGEYRKAVDSLEACLREEPDYPKAHFQLSLAWRHLGDEDKAKQYLDSFNRLQNDMTARALEALGMSNK